MVVKAKFYLIIKIIVPISFVYYYYDLIKRFLNESITYFEYVMLLITPIAGFIGTFMAFTALISFKEEFMHVKYKMSPLNSPFLHKLEDYKIEYENINLVLSLFPLWFPIKLFLISYKMNNRNQTFVLANFLINWKQSLKILIRKIPHKIESNIKKKYDL